ncbi:TlpA family protein disulfide reductase [Pedobacter deserti]|uniref:TlpA family protein disulfide reductase n=1 Tax=Pedobacter deserti TaxID=2817382 RepID=UPI00210ACF12|nr:hypothetical protein [Pedobacter sp. SYSU D00382]
MNRIIFTLILSFTASFTIAQSGVQNGIKVERRTMTGAEYNRLPKQALPTDSRVYDLVGNVLDSTEVQRRLATYEYEVRTYEVGGSLRYVLTKFNERDIERERELEEYLKPGSPLLQKGMTLDLKPFESRTDIEALNGKAVVLIFWCEDCYQRIPDAYKQVNDVLSRFHGSEKLAIITVTHHSVDQSIAALKKSPIVNTQHIVAAADLTSKFETGNKPVIVVTDQNHKIVYATRNWAGMTPRKIFLSIKDLK